MKDFLSGMLSKRGLEVVPMWRMERFAGRHLAKLFQINDVKRALAVGANAGQ